MYLRNYLSAKSSKILEFSEYRLVCKFQNHFSFGRKYISIEVQIEICKFTKKNWSNIFFPRRPRCEKLRRGTTRCCVSILFIGTAPLSCKMYDLSFGPPYYHRISITYVVLRPRKKVSFIG